ncbi:MAG: LamG-like jellyroll fold domain-containing protein, partial [Bacteroidota bacterium]
RTEPGVHPEIASSGIDPDKAVNRFWNITNAGLNFQDLVVTFNWDAADVDLNADFNNFIVKKYDAPDWIDFQVFNRTSLSITAGQLTSFSDFQIGEAMLVNAPGSALHFGTGGNEYITIPSDGIASMTSFTVETWLKADAQQYSFIWEGVSGGFSNPSLEGSSDNLSFWMNDNTSVSTGPLTLGTWNHVACTYDAQTNLQSIYVNGVFVSSVTALAPGSFGGGMILGKRVGNPSYPGAMDELRVWSRALDAQEIADHFNCEILIPMPYLQRNYHFNQGTGEADNSFPAQDFLDDFSGNNIDGTLFNFTLSGNTSNWISTGGVVSGTSCNIIGTFYADNDGDGFGDESNFVTDVVMPEGYTLDLSDCDDTHITYADFDEDGFGTGVPIPCGISYYNNDCDDNNFNINPGAVELCDGIDQNCNSDISENNSLSFDGVSSYVEMQDFNLGENDFTLEAWIYPYATADGYIITNRTIESGGAGNWFGFKFDSGHLLMELAEGGTPGYNVVNGNTSVALNQWSHIAVVRSGLNYTIYLNGNADGSLNDPLSRNLTSGIEIARLGGWPDFNAAWYYGKMDEVRIWNVAKTQAQIRSQMTAYVNGQPNLINYYTFDHGSANNENPGIDQLADLGGTNNNGNLIGFSLSGDFNVSNWNGGYAGTLYYDLDGDGFGDPNNSTAVTTPCFAPGDLVNDNTDCDDADINTHSGCTPAAALNFDGVDDYVSLNQVNNIPTGNSPYTLEAWIKPNALNFNEGFIGYGNFGTQNQANAIRFNGPTQLVNYWWANDLIVNIPNILDGNWHHIAATYDGTTRSIYTDGVLRGQDTPGILNVPTANNLAIGKSFGNEFINGALDEVRIWNVSRTQSQIVDNMNCEINAQPGLAAAFHFNQGFASENNAGTISDTDVSGNNNNATLNNFSLEYGTSNWIAPGGVVSGTNCVCYVNIPDVNFKNALLANASINSNNNGEIECSEASAFNGNIDVNGLSISDLTGIEAFTSLTVLQVYNNLLTTIDVSANTQLNYLDVGGNQLTTLDVSSNTALQQLVCRINQLTSLDISSNQDLFWLECPFNNITSLDLSNNPALEVIFALGNQLSSIDVSNNPLLSTLNFSNNPAITSIDLSQNPALTQFISQNNSLTELDLSSNSNIVDALVDHNNLTSLNIQNGNNSNLNTFNATNNPSLSCIQVDNVNNMIATWNAGKDVSASFSLACPLTAPAAALSFDGVDDHLSTGISLSIAATSTIEFWLYTNDLNDDRRIIGSDDPDPVGTGLRFFNGHLQLTVDNQGWNDIINTAFPVQQWVHVAIVTNGLQYTAYLNGVQGLTLNFTSNYPTINFGNSYTLANVGVFGTNFNGSMDEIRIWNVARTQVQILADMNCEITPQPGLLASYHLNQGIGGAANPTELNLIDSSGNGNNGTLHNFALSGSVSNWITPGAVVSGTACALCIVNIPDAIFKNALLSNGLINTNNDSEIQCNEASVYNGTINVSNMGIADLTGIEAFTSLTGLVCTGNSLTSLDLSSNDQLVTLFCNQNALTTLDLSGHTALQTVYCSLNALTSLDLSGCTGLTILNGGGNQLTTLDVSGSSQLATLSMNSNQISNLNISGITGLTFCELALNSLTGLDVSANAGLTYFNCAANALTSLNMKNINYSNLSYFNAVQNFSLSCIDVDDPSYMNTNWSAAKDAGASYSTNCSFVCNLSLTTSAGDTLFVCAENGATSGDVNLIPLNGIAPYTYTGSDTLNLVTGTYNYFVTDGNGCTATTELKVFVTNCIIPYYEPPTNDTIDNLIGSELTQLYTYPDSLVDTTAANNIFKIDEIEGEVLIEVIANVGQYNTLLALLQTPPYGMNNLIDNGDSTLIITGMFPIANLPKLDSLPLLVNYARPYYTPINGNFALPATGLTTSQGDSAQMSHKAKQA